MDTLLYIEVNLGRIPGKDHSYSLPSQNYCYYVLLSIFPPCLNEVFCCGIAEITNQNKLFTGPMVVSNDGGVEIADAGDVAEFRLLKVSDRQRVNEEKELDDKRRFIGPISRTK